VESEYKKAMEFATYDFPVDIRVAFHQIQPFEPFESSGYTCTALLASHNRLERCYIYLVEKDGKSILYAHDTGYLPDSTWEYLSGRRVDLVSLDCNSMLGSDGYGHMGLPNDEKVREQLIEARCCDDTTIYVVNHFSHNSRLTHEEMVEAAGKKGFLVSYDGMTVEI
jgi:phosphoribosyl 1,2-cyclic phosphate phosphodiesterase